MDPPLVSLIAASIAFVGSHFAMSHPLRAPMVSVLGEKWFPAVYSLISLAALWWMSEAFKAAPATTPLWPGFGDASWIAGSVLSLIAMVLVIGSLTPRNAALPLPGAAKAARADPVGVFRVTRHPMMWGMAIWGLSHIVAAPTARTLVVTVAIIVLALVGSRLQDRKKRSAMGDDWREYEAHTSYWPQWQRLFAIGAWPWIGGIIAWLAISWLHIPLGGQAAGIWRWLG